MPPFTPQSPPLAPQSPPTRYKASKFKAIQGMCIDAHAEALEPMFLRPLRAVARPLGLARPLALVRPLGTCPVVTAEGPCAVGEDSALPPVVTTGAPPGGSSLPPRMWCILSSSLSDDCSVKASSSVPAPYKSSSHTVLAIGTSTYNVQPSPCCKKCRPVSSRDVNLSRNNHTQSAMGFGPSAQCDNTMHVYGHSNR